MNSNNEGKKYYLTVKGEKVEVSEEVYRAYVRPIRREQRQKREEWKCRLLNKNGKHFVRCDKRCSECKYYLSGGKATGNKLSLDALIEKGVETVDENMDLERGYIEKETRREEYERYKKEVPIGKYVLYSATGDDGILSAYAIEQEIKTLSNTSADYIQLMTATEGNKQRYKEEIAKISKKLVALREQLQQAKDITLANEANSFQMEEIRNELLNATDIFSTESGLGIRNIIEYIRVMSEGEIIITFKVGVQVEEEL